MEPNTSRASTNVNELSQACGPHRPAQIANGRLVGLGAAAVVTGGPDAPIGPEGVTWLVDQVSHWVPADAEVVAAGG